MDRVLRNELVLENVATNLPVRDILSIRTTSRIWNSAFVGAMRAAETPVTLCLSATQSFFSYTTRKINTVRDYTTLMSSSLAIPYGSYTLEFEGTDSPTGQLEELRDFLDVCGRGCGSQGRGRGRGHSIRRLEIHFVGFYRGLINVGAFLQPIFEMAPLIEVLGIWAPRRGGSTSNCIDMQIPALRILPVLQTLQIDPYHFQPFEVADLSRRLNHLRMIAPLLQETGGVPDIENLKSIEALKNVRTINLDGLTITMLQALIGAACMKQNSLRLTNFVTTMTRVDSASGGVVHPLNELLHTFLSTQTDTLCRLELAALRIVSSYDKVNQMTRDSPLWLPHLPKLRQFSLKLAGPHYPIQFDGGSMQAALPVLNSFKFTLEISPQSEIWQHNRFPREYEALAHVGVTNLALRLIQNDRLAHFRIWFPAVTCLDIQLGERDLERFSLLWTIWPGLESLRITLPTYFVYGEVWDLDQFLTGIPKSALEAAKSALSEITEITESYNTAPIEKLREIQSKYKTSAGLRDLVQLKNFELKMKMKKVQSDVENSIKLSDLGGYLGLALASPNLQRLEVDEFWRPKDGHKCSPLTPKCLDAIRSGLPRPQYAVLNICGVRI